MSRLEEIKARVEKATPGPWKHGDRYMIAGVILMERPDADFIAHAREDIPYLLAEISRLSDSGAEGLSRKEFDEIIDALPLPDYFLGTSHEAMVRGAWGLADALLEKIGTHPVPCPADHARLRRTGDGARFCADCGLALTQSPRETE